MARVAGRLRFPAEYDNADMDEEALDVLEVSRMTSSTDSLIELAKSCCTYSGDEDDGYYYKFNDAAIELLVDRLWRQPYPMGNELEKLEAMKGNWGGSNAWQEGYLKAIDKAIAIVRQHEAEIQSTNVCIHSEQNSYKPTEKEGDASTRKDEEAVKLGPSPTSDSLPSPVRYSDGSISREYEEQPMDAIETAAKARHEKYRKLGQIEQVAWEDLLPVAQEAAMEDARLMIEAYETAKGHYRGYSVMAEGESSGKTQREASGLLSQPQPPSSSNDAFAIEAAHRAFDNAYCAGETTWRAVDEAIKNYRAYLRSPEPMMVSLEKCALAAEPLLPGAYFTTCEKLARAILKAAGVSYVE